MRVIWHLHDSESFEFAVKKWPSLSIFVWRSEQGAPEDWRRSDDLHGLPKAAEQARVQEQAAVKPID